MELNFDEERAQLNAKRTELLAGVALIDTALATLANEAQPKTRSAKVGKPATPAVRAGRKPMSSKALKAARDRMLAYWAGKRAGKSKTR